MNRQERINYKVNMLFRVIYVLAFNVYSWYWLYKIIWVNQSTWEDWVNWFFVTCGVHFFVIDYSKFWSKNVKSISDIFNPNIE
jgi:hypothetical protein